MRLHVAMKQPDRLQLIADIQKDLEYHFLCKHWKVIPLWSPPPNKQPLLMVWSKKRKQNPLIEIKK